jgi:putative endonuclease
MTLIDRIRKLLCRNEKSSIGARGEKVAAQWLKAQGYRILERNYRMGKDEADLIALDPDGRTIVIVEVKSRVRDRIAPEFSINTAKQRHMARMGSKLQKLAAYRERPLRFDAVAVILPESGQPIVRHHPGAFGSPW